MRFRVMEHDEHDIPLAWCEEALYHWPSPNWTGWLTYDTPLERKLTCADWHAIPDACRRILGRMACQDVSWIGQGLVPDLSLYGAGMHSMVRGGHLDTHLDADRHQRLGLERRANAILFLSDFDADWKGWLELYSPGMVERLACIVPKFGRLVIFETDDESYHGVSGPIKCPEREQRRSLAIYWWSIPRLKETKRPRAQFVSRPGELDNEEKDRLRADRAY